MAYIARFSPRPQTVAAQMKDNVTREEKRRREKVLESVLRQTALENNQKYLNQTVTILVQGINKNSNYYGQTASAKQVVVTGKYRAQKNLVGNFLSVKIKKAQEFSLEAQLI
jgi:tRNA-2-methylthio-N6-dimethylallyladenosine synthase